MKKIKKKIIGSLLIIGLILQTTCISADYVPVGDDKDSGSRINTINKLEKEISVANLDKKITTQEKAKLIQNTSEDVREEYVEQEIKRVFDGEWLKDKELTEFTGDNYTKTIDCGKGTSVKIEFEDKEETKEQESDLLACLSNLFTTEVKAATTQSNTKVKKYGNRFAKFTYSFIVPVGYAEIYVENHYKINDKGITERYLYHQINSISAFTSLKCTFAKITDKYAQKDGYNTNANWTFAITGSNFYTNLQSTFAQIKSTIKLVKLDKKNKQAKVKQSYWADCYL